MIASGAYEPVWAGMWAYEPLALLHLSVQAHVHGMHARMHSKVGAAQTCLVRPRGA